MALRTVLLVVLAAIAASPSVVVRAQDTGRDRLLHYSLQIDVDEEARVQLAASETELANGDVLTAVSRWRAVLDSRPAESLVPVRGAYLSVPVAVRSLLKSQSRDVQREYLQMTEPAAARSLSAATTKDDRKALRLVIERFPLTAAAEQASLVLAEQSFDAGDFQACQATVDRWLDDASDAKAAVTRHPEMLVLRTMAVQALGNAAEAEQTWSKYSDAVPARLQQVVTAGGLNRLAPKVDGAVVPSAPAQVTSVDELLPSEDRIWSQEMTGATPSAEWVSLKSDFEELAHPLLMVGSPRRSANDLVASGFGRQVLDFAGRPKSLQTDSLSAPIGTRLDAIDALRAALGESALGRATVAGDRLYSVQRRRDRPTAPYFSRLTAHSLSTGEAVWTLSEFPRSAGQSPAAATILGQPLERFGRLVLPIQVGDQIELVAIDAATSKVRWQTRLGDAGLGLMTDTRRLWMPAVITAAGDSVLCATGNGAVASVDIETGHIRWIHRSQREDWRDAGPPPMSATMNLPRIRMWTGWREPVLQEYEDVVIWAGPEANSLTAIDRRTGVVRWSQPRGDRLEVIAADSALLTIAEDQVQRLNPIDGTLLWSATVAAPGGVGFSAGGWYALPLRTGGTVALRLTTGEVIRSVAWNAEVLRKSPSPMEQLRSLNWTPAGIVAQTPGSVALYRTVAEVRRKSGATTSPQQFAASGRLPEAVGALAVADSNASAVKVRLEAIARESERDQFHIATAPGEQIAPSAIDPRVSQRLEAFLNDRRPETAFALMESCSLKDLSANWVESNATPRRRIRADRFVAATLIDVKGDQIEGRVIAELSPATQQRLDKLLLTLRSERPQEIPELYVLVKSTEWGANHLLLHLERPESAGLSARQQARRRLALMDLATGRGDIGARARQIASTLVPQKRPITDWPAGEVRPVKPDRQLNSYIDHRPMTVDILGETELAGLSAEFRLNSFNDRKSGLIQFAGCGEDRPWAFDLPKTSRNLATSADYRNATVLGPLVLTQVGCGLFGFLAFDETGRGISNLWDVPWIDAWGRVSTHSVNFLPRLSDVAPGRHPMELDDFGRPLTQLGPVTPSYFCYREFDRLVACETATGRRLWDRRHYDPDAFAAGTGEVIILISPRANRVEFLDPLDGRSLLSRDLGRSTHDWRETIETLAILRSGRSELLTETKAEPSELTALDVLADTVRWKQAIPAEAIDFTVGRRLVGAVHKSSLRLFDTATGEERANLAIKPPADFSEVYAIDDPFALMIGVFSPPALEQLRPPMILIGNRRRPYANGVVYGLDPKTLELKWALPLDKSVFPLDQPRDIPLLVLNDAALKHDDHGNEIAEDRIRCFDKRTGVQVGGDLSGRLVGQYLTIERDQVDGWVQIRTKNGVFRFNFTPAER